jgi:hypothetical protein
MSANTSKYPQPSFTQAIALSGDRAGSKGMFQFAGFAWIWDTKVTLVHGDGQSLKTPPEWRQLLRLINLAYRLRKPIILWNLPVVHIATKQRKTSLAITQSIQNTELALLKLPHPIITVFDENYDGTYPPLEWIWNDGLVLVGSPDTRLAESEKVKIVQHPTEIASAILKLLYQAEVIPTPELIANRSVSLYMLAKSKTEFSL